MLRFRNRVLRLAHGVGPFAGFQQRHLLAQRVFLDQARHIFQQRFQRRGREAGHVNAVLVGLHGRAGNHALAELGVLQHALPIGAELRHEAVSAARIPGVFPDARRLGPARQFFHARAGIAGDVDRAVRSAAGALNIVVLRRAEERGGHQFQSGRRLFRPRRFRRCALGHGLFDQVHRFQRLDATLAVLLRVTAPGGAEPFQIRQRRLGRRAHAAERAGRAHRRRLGRPFQRPHQRGNGRTVHGGELVDRGPAGLGVFLRQFRDQARQRRRRCAVFLLHRRPHPRLLGLHGRRQILTRLQFRHGCVPRPAGDHELCFAHRQRRRKLAVRPACQHTFGIQIPQPVLERLRHSRLVNHVLDRPVRVLIGVQDAQTGSPADRLVHHVARRGRWGRRALALFVLLRHFLFDADGNTLDQVRQRGRMHPVRVRPPVAFALDQITRGDRMVLLICFRQNPLAERRLDRFGRLAPEWDVHALTQRPQVLEQPRRTEQRAALSRPDAVPMVLLHRLRHLPIQMPERVGLVAPVVRPGRAPVRGILHVRVR